MEEKKMGKGRRRKNEATAVDAIGPTSHIA